MDGHDASHFGKPLEPLETFTGDIDTLKSGVVYLGWNNIAVEKLPNGNHPYILITLLRPDGGYGFRIAQQIDRSSVALWAQNKADTWQSWHTISIV